MDQNVGTPARYIECMEFFLAPYPLNCTPAQGDPTKAVNGGPLLDNVLGMEVEYLDAGRRLRVTLRLSPAIANPLVPAFEVSCDVRPPNLQGP